MADTPGAPRPRQRRRPWRTVRFRVTSAALASVLVVLLVASVALLAAVRAELGDQLDDDLSTRVEQLATLAADGRLPDELSDLGDDTLVQIRSTDGSTVLRTVELDDDTDDLDEQLIIVQPPPEDGDDAGSGSDDELDVRVTTETFADDDDAHRVATTTVSSPDGPLSIGVARSVVDLESSVQSIALVLLVAGPIVALLLAAITWGLVGRTLRPVDTIRRQVAAIGVGQLDRRVPEPGTDDEIDRLARTMNDMLERLDAGATRERRFVSDASHELRSPLTRMRLGLEVDQAHPDSADPAATNELLLDEVIGMQRLVDELLQLAHLDSGTARTARELVDLDDLVLAEVAALRSATGANIDQSAVGAVQTLGDARALRRVIRNLLENAARHAATVVSVSLIETERDLVLTVGDDGPGIAESERTRVFERFVRLDEARSVDAGGAGLGLAIARLIVEQHGGTIVVETSPTGGAAFVVALPRSTD